MLVRQSKNAFIRTTDHYGYIINQLTYQDRTYDEIGALFLKQITRTPKSIDGIVRDLCNEFEDSLESVIKADLNEFLQNLADDKFIVIGESDAELDEKDEDFTYNIEIPNTIREDFSQKDVSAVPQTTQDFFREEVQGRPLISTLQFELTSRCNERCIHCYIPNAKKNAGFDMPLDKIKSIIDEFASMGGISVTLSGGEVMMHKKLIDVLEYCRLKDLKISILSNLIVMTDALLAAIKKANVSVVQVSLYSMNPEIHDFITTVSGSWMRTKDAIEKLVAKDVPVQISCPLMKANKEGYDKVLDYAHSLKIKAQTDYIMMARSDLDTENLANRLSIEETAKVIREIVINDLDFQEQTLTLVPPTVQMEVNKEKFLEQPLCSVGYDNCCIAANGDVYPCAGWQDYVLGNINNQSLYDIWNNSERLKQLRKITQASFPKCTACEAINYCARCLVRNYNESGGDMFAVNEHFCNVAFLTKRIVEDEFGPELERREKILERNYKRMRNNSNIQEL